MPKPELTREMVRDQLAWICEGVNKAAKETRLESIATGLTRQQRQARIEKHAQTIAAADFIKHCAQGIEQVLWWLPEVLLWEDDEAPSGVTGENTVDNVDERR